jgi:hypothetical protein
MVQDREGYILYPENYPEHKLEEFMLGNLILFLIMLLCIVMRLLTLGIQLISECLKRRLLMHQMNIAFHSRLLMLLLCLQIRQGSCQICWGQTQESKDLCLGTQGACF